MEQVRHAREDPVEIGRAPFHPLLAREGEELVGEPGSALSGLHGVVQQAQDAFVRDLARRQLDRSHHGGQQIVEIVRDASGELADRLHRTALRDLVLGFTTQFRQFEIGTDPGKQLARREWLDEIVVGPGLQALDARIRSRAGREHDDGHRPQGRVPPDLARERDPVEERHHHVGEQKVRGTFLERLEGRNTVGHSDDVVGAPEQALDIAPHIGIVVGQDDARTTRHRRCRVVVRMQNHHVRWRRGFGQPTQSFLDIGRDHAARRVSEFARDPVLRKMRGPGRHRHRERGSSVDRALDLDRAAMHRHEFANQGEPDAGAFVRAAARSLDPVEAFEDPRQRVRRDADARVGDGEAYRSVDRREPDRDGTREGILEGVREEVEDHLLPHVPVDMDRPGQGRHFDRESNAAALHCRTEAACDIRGQRGEVDGRKARLDAACLDAREIEQRVDQPQEPQRIAMGDFQLVPNRPVDAVPREGVFQGSEHQREGCAELVADIREEAGLGPVEFGQFLGPAALLLIGAGIPDRGRDLSRNEVQEPGIAVVEGAARTDAED